MTHTLKTGLRGFTLIELLVVIAIIGLLSTVIAGPVQTGLKKGRDARKIADVKQIQSALAQYSADNGGLYPATLADLAPSYLALSASFATSTSPRDRIAYVTFADTTGNRVFYHLGVALENQNIVLQSDADCGSGSNETDCSSLGSVVFTNYDGPVDYPSGDGSTDFQGTGTAEANNGTCTNVLTTCVYDVVPQ